MKFSVLYKKNPDVVEYFEENRGKKYGNGASLEELREFRTSDGREGYAFCCKGSIFSYWWRKHTFKGLATVKKGWGD